MLRRLVILGVVVLLLMSNQGALRSVEGTAVDRYARPRLDEVYMKIFSDPQAATAAFLSGEVDIYPGMAAWLEVEQLIAENQSVLSMESFRFTYFGVNTRSYVPGDAAQPDAGRSLAPLNWTSFRQGLLWAVPSVEAKAEALSVSISGVGATPIGSVVPPQWGLWHNPTFPQPGGNFTKAWELMQAGGFYINNSVLYQPNGVVVRDSIKVHVEINILLGLGPVIDGYLEWWNNFTDSYLGVTNCSFELSLIPSGDLLTRAFQYRNFDIYFAAWEQLNRFPDYLYDLFHSSQEGASKDNSCGIRNDTLDSLLETLRFSLDLAQKVDAAYRAQKLVMTELCPYAPVYSPKVWTAFSRRSETSYLTGMVNQCGFGADNRWTWNLLHWSDQPTGGRVDYALVDRGAEMTTLHPGWASAEEWNVLARIYDPLIASKPRLRDLPWAAGSWRVEPFEWAPLNISAGTKITFQLRSDLAWHDGAAVTSADVKFAWEFMRHFPELEPVWTHFVWAESVDPCTVMAYMNLTSQWVLYDLAQIALMFPKHIYDHSCVQGVYAGASPIDAPLWNISYLDWQGYAAPAIPHLEEDLTALIGCGAFIFDYWNTTSSTIHLVRNPDYWVDSSVEANCLVPSQRVELGAEVGFRIELVNTGSTSGDRLVTTQIDEINITVDGIAVATVLGPVMLDPFETTFLNGTFLHTFAVKGVHHVGCRVYENSSLLDDYRFAVYVTVTEDFNFDYTVDVFDVVIVSLAFGARPGDPHWDSRADINQDWTIDIFDMIQVALNFGWI